MFDGEGWISAGHVGVSQKPGKVLDRIKKLLNEYGMSTREHDNNGCFILVAHNLWESMKLLGVLKPLRLFGKAGTIWEGRRGFNGMGGPSAHGTGRKAKDGGRHVAKIISVESIGEGDVIAVETSTKTLIADGFLGHNCTVYFNEVSQLPYDTVTTVLTRLSQNIPGCRNMAYYDCNPAGRLHWANKIFLHGELPDGKPCGPGYAYLKVNPEDNRNNLPPRFIEDILERLPEQKRKRFLLGEWTDPEGTIFTNWDVAEITEEIRLHSRHTYGLDFGFSVDPAVLTDIYVNGDDVWIDELVYETQLTNDDLGEQMKTLIVEGVTVWADCAEPKSIEELRRKFGYRIEGALKGPDSVRVGIDWLLAKRIHVTGRSANLQMELANYTWKTTREGAMQPEPIDDYNHAIDSIRYGCSEGIGEPQRVYQEPTWSAAELGL